MIARSSNGKKLTKKADLGCRIDGELELGLFPVVDREALHKEGGEAWAGASPEGVKDKEALEPGALVSQLPDAVQHQVYNLLSCTQNDQLITQYMWVLGIRIFPIKSKKSKKLIFDFFSRVFFYLTLFLKTDIKVPSKSNLQKIFTNKLFFVDTLKATDE